MRSVETSFDRSVQGLRNDFLVFRAEMSAKLAETKSELLRWMFTFWVGQVAVTVAIIKLIK
jgi:hypothetical protein